MSLGSLIQDIPYEWNHTVCVVCVCILHMVYQESALLRFQLLDTLWQNPEIVTNLASFHPSWLTSSLNCCLEVIFLRFHHSECWEGLRYINIVSPRSLLRIWWRPVCIWSHSKKLYLGPKYSGNPVIGSVSFTNISLNSLSLSHLSSSTRLSWVLVSLSMIL